MATIRAFVLAAHLALCAVMAAAMGPPPSACINLQPATLLQTRLVNVTAPDGSVSSFTLTADTKQPIDILLYSHYIVELSLRTPVVKDAAQTWVHTNYFGFENGMCIDIPATSTEKKEKSMWRSKVKKHYNDWVLPLDVQLTNISPAGGLRTVYIYGAGLDLSLSWSVTFDVNYTPAAV